MSDHNEVLYEKTDANPKLNLYIFSGITVFCAAMVLLMIPFTLGLKNKVDASGSPSSKIWTSPSVQLETHPSADFKLHSEDNEKLTSEFAWVDESKGVVRVPIEKAMELSLKKNS